MAHFRSAPKGFSSVEGILVFKSMVGLHDRLSLDGTWSWRRLSES